MYECGSEDKDFINYILEVINASLSHLFKPGNIQIKAYKVICRAYTSGTCRAYRVHISFYFKVSRFNFK